MNDAARLDSKIRASCIDVIRQYAQDQGIPLGDPAALIKAHQETGTTQALSIGLLAKEMAAPLHAILATTETPQAGGARANEGRMKIALVRLYSWLCWAGSLPTDPPAKGTGFVRKCILSVAVLVASGGGAYASIDGTIPKSLAVPLIVIGSLVQIPIWDLMSKWKR